MKKTADEMVPVIICLFLTLVFMCVGIKYEQTIFLIFSAIAFLSSIFSFLINRYVKQYAGDHMKRFVDPTYILFAGTCGIVSGIILSERTILLIAGIFMFFEAAFIITNISEIRHEMEDALSYSTKMAPEIIKLYAVRKSKSYNSADWYCIDKNTGKAYVFLSNGIEATDFETIRQQAHAKYACCFLTKEMKKHSYWNDFTEDNWWKKLKIKFEKQKASESSVGTTIIKPCPSATTSSKPNTPSPGTFICTVCKKEKSNRYLHHHQICTDCHKSNLSSLKPPLPSKNPTNTSDSNSVLYLGKFDFSNADTQKVKSAAIRFLPSECNRTDSQSQFLSYLSSVMDVSLVHLTVDWLWEHVENVEPDSKDESLKKALVKTILTVDQTLSCLNPVHLTGMVQKASAEDLLKAWITLDYYGTCLKSEYTQNIRHYRDYIQNVLLQLEKNASTYASDPVTLINTEVHIDTKAYFAWEKGHPLSVQYEKSGIILLAEKIPAISLFEDNVKIREYCLETEESEDFTGKYFFISVRITNRGIPAAVAVQLDGFISNNAEERQMTSNDIGYRMEACFLNTSGDAAKTRYEMLRGKDLDMKALKYVGYTTPSNVRLIGYCPECKKTFAFHGYAFYMMQDDVLYSDDGLDVCTVSSYEVNKETTYTCNGKAFRYYNSFNCPHCKTPYIDYKKYPEIKVFGASGCVLLGKKHYRIETGNTNKPELDFTTSIQDLKHFKASAWHQYDILLNTSGYGWDAMIRWADYMTSIDIENISQVIVSPSIGGAEKDITESYKQNGEVCLKTPDLKSESGVLSIAGISKTLKAPIKIVWFNQTKILRFFTLNENENIMRRYAETVIRRTFGTKEAMKLGKPFPEGSNPQAESKKTKA